MAWPQETAQVEPHGGDGLGKTPEGVCRGPVIEVAQSAECRGHRERDAAHLGAAHHRISAATTLRPSPTQPMAA